MPHIVLTEEQARIVAEASGAVDVRDPQGRTVARLTPLSATDQAALEEWQRTRGTKRPLVPAEQRRAHFRRLEEIRQKEGMDVEKALDLLRRMRAGEQV